MTKTESNPSQAIDLLRWALVLMIVAACVVGNIYYSTQISYSLRAIAFILFGILALWIAAQTSQGKIVVNTLRDARLELRKVVWPTRQETVTTTLTVVAFVAIMAVVLWGVDAFFEWFIRALVA